MKEIERISSGITNDQRKSDAKKNERQIVTLKILFNKVGEIYCVKIYI